MMQKISAGCTSPAAIRISGMGLTGWQATPTRAGENAKRFLNGIEPGFYLMADGYQGYNKVPEINRCCCWAHIRRYLLESIPKGMDKDYTNPAVQGFLYCEKLFAYESSYREKGLSHKQIFNRRLKDEKPVIEGFLSWLNQVTREAMEN